MFDMITDIINADDKFLLFFGSFYLVLGLSCFFAKKAWEDFTDLFVENDALSLIMGILILPVSLSIIVFYNDWDGVASIILMVIGYLALFKSVILLMVPHFFQTILKKEFVRKWIWLDGISGMLLGAALLFL